MSSPNGKRGHFCENWEHGVGVERIKIIGRECPRIGAEFLEKMRQKLGPMLFRQEFEGEFIDAVSSASDTTGQADFRRAVIGSMRLARHHASIASRPPSR